MILSQVRVIDRAKIRTSLDSGFAVAYIANFIFRSLFSENREGKMENRGALKSDEAVVDVRCSFYSNLGVFEGRVRAGEGGSHGLGGTCRGDEHQDGCIGGHPRQ